MAKFFGKVGYGDSIEFAPGVFDDIILERTYQGDVVRSARQMINDDKVNSDITVGNAVSIVADAYALQHVFAMRYVEWAGSLWEVSSVEVQAPRLIIQLGGVYRGPTPRPAGTP